MIENTENSIKAGSLLGLTGNLGGYIEQMEADGQRQLVNSIYIPTRILDGDDDDLRALGLKLGGSIPDDPLFRVAILPEGWNKRASDHSVWSTIVDSHGRERISMFYKAAFYDRRAFTRITSVEGYAWALTRDQTVPLVLDEWATLEKVREAVLRDRERNAGYTFDLEFWAERVEACDRVLAQLDACERLRTQLVSHKISGWTIIIPPSGHSG